MATDNACHSTQYSLYKHINRYQQSTYQNCDLYYPRCRGERASARLAHMFPAEVAPSGFSSAVQRNVNKGAVTTTTRHASHVTRVVTWITAVNRDAVRHNMLLLLHIIARSNSGRFLLIWNQ